MSQSEDSALRYVADAQATCWRCLEGFRERQRGYVEKHGWSRAIFCVPKIVQLLAFTELQHHFNDRDYWRMLAHITLHSHNHAIFIDLYRYLMRAPRAGAHKYFMPRPWFQFWCLLPERILLFRGHGSNNKDGLYYTINPLAAFCFALQHENGNMTGHFAAKTDCFYIGTGRNTPKAQKMKNESQVLHVPGMGEIQAAMNGTDETAKEKLRQQWHDNPPEGFTTKEQA